MADTTSTSDPSDTLEREMFGGTNKNPTTTANNPGIGPRTQKDKKNNPDSNMVDNRANQGRSERLTANLVTVGMPHIRTRKCVSITNVGQWSGDWYVKGVKHSWSASKGYITDMSLMRDVGEQN